MKPKITIYIATHNYGQYLDQAIQSVLKQSFQDFELILIDDGSNDSTKEIIYTHFVEPNERVKIIINDEPLGLIKCSNIAIKAASGEYVLRLDADDWLDPHALLILSTYLDQHQDVDMVYPDFYHASKCGEVIEHVKKNNISHDVTLFDLPAHGACFMIRRSVILKMGFYDETHTCQDGYWLWLRICESYITHNVSLPLFFYRIHGNSLTSNQEKILKERRKIKRNYAKSVTTERPVCYCIIPARGDACLKEFLGETLLERTIAQAANSGIFGRIIIVSENMLVLNQAKKTNYTGLFFIQRPDQLADNVSIDSTIKFTMDRFRDEPDYVFILHPNCPLRLSEHIQEALDTMQIFKTDSVISVTEDSGTFYKHDGSGLKQITERRLLKYERDQIYREDGTIFVTKPNFITDTSIFGEKVGHILIEKNRSYQIESPIDFKICEILYGWRNG